MSTDRPPRITQSELLRQWQTANRYSLEAKLEECGECGATMRTGEILFQFPPLKPRPENVGQDVAIVRSEPLYRCTTCSYQLLGAGAKFDGVGVFVEKQHLNRTLEELPEAVRDRITESFALVDQLFANLEAAFRGTPVLKS